MTKSSAPMSALEGKKAQQAATALKASMADLTQLIQPDQYVGETLKMDYRNITIVVHDHLRRKVGGIPHLSYLVATRLSPDNLSPPQDEDSSAILLRVLGSAPLPSDSMDTIIRAEAARRATGREYHWDTKQVMDPYTRNELSFAGLSCEIVGTFYLARGDAGTNELRFGTDISNFYPNSGLKVYKPVSAALETIVNFRDFTLSPLHALRHISVPIGHVRYASANREMQGIDTVPVSIAPTDLLAQRSALFGMSRTGKSNTTKVIAKSIYDLRRDADNPAKVGQVIFDYNGEYANENMQGTTDAAENALRNVWRETEGATSDVVTYGLTRPKTDPGRRLLQINAYGNLPSDWNNFDKVTADLDMLVVGKNILDDLLAGDTAKYIKNFIEVDLSVPDSISDASKQTRYRRAVLIYRALLKKAGLEPSASLAKPDTRGLKGNGLFGATLLDAMRTSPDVDKNAEYARAADILDVRSIATLTWDRLIVALEALADFIAGKSKSGYTQFNTVYVSSSSTGEAWADTTVESLLEMFRFSNGFKSVARLTPYHEASNTMDFAEQVYQELLQGNLVIIDQSGGEPSMNDAAARRIMWAIFRGNQTLFTSGTVPTDILVYVEEAHNLLPNSNDLDLKDVWVRTAKEGSKYRIGLVYATQEVSSIQKNILKNTANWFIAHLNNTDETRELKKFYDFANFEDSILRAQDRGFLRVKTLSNPYINPVQVGLFRLIIPASMRTTTIAMPTHSATATGQPTNPVQSSKSIESS